MNTEHLVCQCGSPEHTLNFIYFNEEQELYGFIHLNNFSFWTRFLLGIRYILGINSKHGHFEEFMMRQEDVEKLVKVLQAVKPVVTDEVK